MLLVDFIEISTKSTKDDTNYTHQKIEPIKAGFSTNDRLVSLWVQPICRGMGYNILQAGAPADRGCLAM